MLFFLPRLSSVRRFGGLHETVLFSTALLLLPLCQWASANQAFLSLLGSTVWLIQNSLNKCTNKCTRLYARTSVPVYISSIEIPVIGPLPSSVAWAMWFRFFRFSKNTASNQTRLVPSPMTLHDMSAPQVS